ncbi:MAG: RNA polymerase sigma factor [Gammaproteobacteria bacterium]
MEKSVIRHQIETIYRHESRRIFATLLRLLGDFDAAEEALQEAFRAAAEQWPEDGLPASPRAWLISAGRFKAIDRIRRESRLNSARELLQFQWEEEADEPFEDGESIEDDRLRLIFTCCHPALASESQIALTLREVCGLTTEAIASAFLIPAATLAQRIVRGKAKIRSAGIPYEIPSIDELPERLDNVLTVVYLIFNEGYHASSGNALTRPDLSQEAIRLGRLLLELIPDSEVIGLLALMLLHESRRLARTTADGNIILLEHQDRSLWNQELIVEAKTLLQRAFASGQVGSYAIEAAIAALHADAPDTAETDWNGIVFYYDMLLTATPSPVVELNRAVAVAMRDGPAAGLDLIETIFRRGDLTRYPLAHAAHADLCRRLGQNREARLSYQKALEMSAQEPAQKFLRQRLDELSD